MFVLMLEDDLERIHRFESILSHKKEDHTLLVRRTAWSFIDEFDSLASTPTLIALDHDLFTDNISDPDPGDGRDVAQHLAKHKSLCPVLIHSTNTPASISMLFALRETGWIVDRISPIGEDWIETLWYPYAMDFLQNGPAD